MSVKGMQNSHKGFTLVELMIVIAIIGVLAAIAIPQFSTYRQKGYNTKAKAELRSFYTACQAYFSVHSSSNNCDFSTVSDIFTKTDEVEITTATGQAMYNTTAYHTSGTITYTLGSSGNISP